MKLSSVIHLCDFAGAVLLFAQKWAELCGYLNLGFCLGWLILLVHLAELVLVHLPKEVIMRE